MMNFTGIVGRGDNLRYKMDILGPGQIGTYLLLLKVQTTIFGTFSEFSELSLRLR